MESHRNDRASNMLLGVGEAVTEDTQYKQCDVKFVNKYKTGCKQEGIKANEFK